jgi:hypothetical protein
MSHLGISLAVRGEIENTWNNIERKDWLLIEEKASQWLQADLAAKTNLFPSPILSAALPEYIGCEEAKIDQAVLEAAFWVLGRPAFTAQWERRDTEARHFDNSIEDPLLTELHVPDPLLTELHVPDPSRGNWHRTTRLQSALAWGRSCNESINATIDANDAVFSEVKIPIPKPRSSSLLSSRPNATRTHAKGASSVP